MEYNESSSKIDTQEIHYVCMFFLSLLFSSGLYILYLNIAIVTLIYMTRFAWGGPKENIYSFYVLTLTYDCMVLWFVPIQKDVFYWVFFHNNACGIILNFTRIFCGYQLDWCFVFRWYVHYRYKDDNYSLFLFGFHFHSVSWWFFLIVLTILKLATLIQVIVNTEATVLVRFWIIEILHMNF